MKDTGKPSKRVASTRKRKGSSSHEFVEQSNQALATIVDKGQAHDAKGQFVGKLTEQDYDWALERLASGDTMRNVCATLKVSRSALLVKASKDAEFERLLKLSMEVGAFNLVENSMNAVLGGECSTGSIERDKLVAQFTQWYAARINRKVFGDRATIEAQSMTIVLKPDDTGW